MVQVVRSAGLLVVAVLAFLLAACSVGHVYAQWGVAVSKIAIGGEDTDFGFKVVGPGGQVEDFVLKDGEAWGRPVLQVTGFSLRRLFRRDGFSEA